MNAPIRWHIYLVQLPLTILFVFKFTYHWAQSRQLYKWVINILLTSVFWVIEYLDVSEVKNYTDMSYLLGFSDALSLSSLSCWQEPLCLRFGSQCLFMAISLTMQLTNSSACVCSTSLPWQQHQSFMKQLQKLHTQFLKVWWPYSIAFVLTLRVAVHEVIKCISEEFMNLSLNGSSAMQYFKRVGAMEIHNT